jgi:hypothetical protein
MFVFSKEKGGAETPPLWFLYFLLGGLLSRPPPDFIPSFLEGQPAD